MLRTGVRACVYKYLDIYLRNVIYQNEPRLEIVSLILVKLFTKTALKTIQQ